MLHSLRKRCRRPPEGPDRAVSHRIRQAIRVVLAFAAVVAGPGHAVLISTGDGTGNTTAPPNDPGFTHVGVVNGLSGVYVGNGWVLTANHVGEHPILLDGAGYEPVPGSRVRFEDASQTPADLIAYKLVETPPLPDLTIASSPRAVGEDVTLIGNGRNRGAATSWTHPPSGILLDGWAWGSGREIRWGTNSISVIDDESTGTRAFWTELDPPTRGGPPGEHESDVVSGDSGGAAFLGSGSSAELVGILFAHGSFEGQPANTSLRYNAGLIVDLYAYRADILAVIEQPTCDDGLDEDGDGLTDYPADPGCTSPSDSDEREATLTCDNGIDDDGDGLSDLADPGCDDPTDPDERGSTYQCDNGLDDDLDGLIDYPADPGCAAPTSPYELPEPGLALGLALGTLLLARLPRPAPRPT